MKEEAKTKQNNQSAYQPHTQGEKEKKKHRHIPGDEKKIIFIFCILNIVFFRNGPFVLTRRFFKTQRSFCLVLTLELKTDPKVLLFVLTRRLF
jgi:hypothetical protein